MDKTVLIVL